MSDAEERLQLAHEALVSTGYFDKSQVGDDVAPRILEMYADLTRGTRSGYVHTTGYLLADDAKDINVLTRLCNNYGEDGWRFTGWSKDVQNGTFYMFERKT
jgi:hypothetical protein